MSLDPSALGSIDSALIPASGPLSVVVRLRIDAVPTKPLGVLANKPIDAPEENGLAIILAPSTERPELIDVAASVSDAQGTPPDLMHADTAGQILRVGRNQITRAGSTHTIALVIDPDSNAMLYTSLAGGELAAVGIDARRLGSIASSRPLEVGLDPSFVVHSVMIFDRVLGREEIRSLAREPHTQLSPD